MARKSASTLRGRERDSQRATGGVQLELPTAPNKSWASVGVDSSLTAISAVGIGFDATLDKMVGPSFAEIRWTIKDEYFTRLGQAAKGHELILSVLRDLWAIELDRVVIVCEEPWFYGAVRKGQSAWLKQQAEVAGAFKGSLARYGFPNIYEINNSQWKRVLRAEGVPFLPGNKKDPDMKFKVKRWAIQAFGLPDLPDLVKDKSGSKIPRPESGFGAKAKAIQPSDVYDAAALCAWGADEIEAGKIW